MAAWLVPRITLLALFLILGGPPVQGQSPRATISGRILDQSTGEPLPFASVVIKNESTGETVTGALTDEQGRFTVEGLAVGEYSIWPSFPGHRPAQLTALIGERNDIYELGDIELEKVPGFEDELTVTGEEILAAGLDTRVFNVEDNLAQSTGSLLDAMKALPGVTVDQEGKVSLRGSDRVAILIDGKQSSLTGFGNQRGLDSVSAANVESIEIIHNPSSRFDAAGMAGIINIIYKKESEIGWSGDVGLTLGAGQLSKQRDDLPTDLGSFSNNQKVLPSVNLNYNQEKLRTFFQSELLLQDDLPNNEFTTRTYDDGRVIASQVPENREQTHYIIKTGADWTLRRSDIFNASAIYDFETHTDRAQVPFVLEQTQERERYWFWREKEDTGFANLTLDYRHHFDQPGHEISVNLQYTRGWEDEAYFLNEESSVRVGTDFTHLDATEHTLPLAIDYVRPLRQGRVEAGLKVQQRWIPITYDVERGMQSVIYPGLGNWSEWGEDIAAGYVNYVRERRGYSLEAGLRIEQTDVYYEIPAENIYYEGSDEYGYFELYPNVKLTYKANTNNNVIAAFNRRVDRPGEPELRIFPKYDDPELLKVGNPYLRPQFTDVLELGLERFWDGGSATASIYYRDIDDPFLRVYAIDDSNPSYDIVNKIFQNTGSAINSGVELLVTQDMAENWRLTGSVNWFVNDIDAFETTLLFPTVRPFLIEESDDDTWDLKLGSTFNLPLQTELQLSFVYYADRNVPQGTQKARSSFDLAFKRTVMEGRAEILFTASDVFNQFGLEQAIGGEGFSAVYQNYFETQVVNVGMKYRF